MRIPVVILMSLILLFVPVLPGGATTCADDYVLAAEEVLEIDENLSLTGYCLVQIDGDILAVPGSGASISIDADEIMISGTLQAGSGAEQATPLQGAGSLQGLAGGNGGNIMLRARCTTCTISLSLADSSQLVAGEGGAGQAAIAYGDAIGTANAVGGLGGNGGSIYLLGSIGHFASPTWPGRGGEGGVACSTAIHAEALGGGGGDSGTIRPGWVAFGLPTPRAGPGGDAQAVGLPFAVAHDDPWDEVLQTLQDVSDALCSVFDRIQDGDLPQPPVRPFGTPGNPDIQTCHSNFILGISGLLTPASGPYDAHAEGGDGGDGLLEGGPGGSADATACPFPGGGSDGIDGQDYSCHAGVGNCPDKAGNGVGGTKGPNGGSATAIGGSGGVGLIRGGDGGAATAEGGMGGYGGRGGRGGNGINGFCISGGDGGDGGPGGDGGAATATGGNGGNALLVIGAGGAPGEPAAVGGPPGISGVPGPGGKGGAPLDLQLGGGPLPLGLGVQVCQTTDGVPGQVRVGATGPEDPTWGTWGTAGSMSVEESIDYIWGP